MSVMEDEFAELNNCQSINSFSESGRTVVSVLKKQGWGLHYLGVKDTGP
jgi:hypothetical protein